MLIIETEFADASVDKVLRELLVM